MITIRTLLVATLLLAACGGKQAPETLEACEARWNDFMRFMIAHKKEPSTGLRYAPKGLLEIDRLEASETEEENLALTLTAEGVSLEGDLQWTAKGGGSIAEALAAPLEKGRSRIVKIAASRGDQPSNTAAFLISPDTPWRMVVETSEAARARGFEKQAFWFLRKQAIAKPGPAAVDGELADLEKEFMRQGPLETWGAGPPLSLSARRAAATVPLTQRFMSACSDAENKNPPREFKAGDCRCRIDTASVKAVFWYFAPPDLITSVVRTTAAPDAPAAKELAFPADAPWSETHRALVEAANDVPLVLTVQAAR